VGALVAVRHLKTNQIYVWATPGSQQTFEELRKECKKFINVTPHCWQQFSQLSTLKTNLAITRLLIIKQCTFKWKIKPYICKTKLK
jgi:hypothetical protein